MEKKRHKHIMDAMYADSTAIVYACVECPGVVKIGQPVSTVMDVGIWSELEESCAEWIVKYHKGKPSNKLEAFQKELDMHTD